MKLVAASLFVILALLTFSFPLNNAIPTATASHSATAPLLGGAADFGLLASTITNANPTIVFGHVGSGLAGQTAPILDVTGVNHFNDLPYVAANTALTSAITDAQDQDCDDDINSAAVLTGIYNHGVYCINGAASFAGTITLDGSGVYIFKITGALATAAASNVVLTGGATPDNIFWVVTGATTLGANSNFVGTIMSNAVVTVGAGSTVDGCVLTTGPLTIATSTITCTTLGTSSSTPELIDLQSAESFAILATTITNANPTTIYGDVGKGPVGQVTAFTGVNSHIHWNNDEYNLANTDLISAIADGRSIPCDTLNPGVVDLTLLTYTPGVYCIGGAANIPAGTLTLDGSGLYIFKITGALNMIAGTSVVLTNGATSDNIFWVMTGASTLGTGSTFVGTILSHAAITIGSGATVDGRALTTGPLTIDSSIITVSVDCSLIGPDANLIGCDLTGMLLAGANLSGANLSGADLSGMLLDVLDLSGANLSGADLTGAELFFANLSGANLSGADLSGANLSGADLSDADLTGANLDCLDHSICNT